MKPLALSSMVLAALAILLGGPGSRPSAHAAASTNSVTFQDGCPDNPGSTTPDLCSVQVSNDDMGGISFVVEVLNQLDLGLVTNSHVVIDLDTDGNASTGCGPNRADVELAAHGGSSRGTFSELVCRNVRLPQQRFARRLREVPARRVRIVHPEPLRPRLADGFRLLDRVLVAVGRG